MSVPNASVFHLPPSLAAKADPALTEADERHFATVAGRLRETVDDLTARLGAELRSEGGLGQQAMDRDLEVHRLAARLRALRRSGLELCLGRIVAADDPAPAYVGRLGLTGAGGERLLLDWRSPAAEPFFGATHAHPMGLASRRRYRWAGGRVRDYWDEVFTADGLTGPAALDDQSAFIASLGASRSPRMRDVLATIAADQDAAIRAGSGGALVVDGGPGTGKTVVALHRTAYLLYADPRLRRGRGGTLFVGPHQPYLAYVGDVLPSLGEEGVLTCTLADLVPEGAAAGPEADPQAARLKASGQMAAAVEAAVGFYEQPPATAMAVPTPWGEVWLDAGDWAAAFAAAEPGTPHNEARYQVWDELLDIAADRAGPGDLPPGQLRRSLQASEELRAAFNRAWPRLDAADLVGDLWSVPAYLRRCAPWLTADEARRLRRPRPDDGAGPGWTQSDLPVLDAARARLGDPAAARQGRRLAAARDAERARMNQVVADYAAVAGDQAGDEYGSGLVTMLRHGDFGALVDEAALPAPAPERLAGPFAHVVVDEAQELTDAEWQMLLRRCPSRSFTIAGDRAQARSDFPGSWPERLAQAGFEPSRVTVATLTVNYRTPQEVMDAAAPVIRAVRPDANVPVSVRRAGIAVTYGRASELDAVLDDWLAGQAEGTGCVISLPPFGGKERPRIRRLTPGLAKGLEFDLVVLVDPERFGDGRAGAVDRYVAMTRATQRLVILRTAGAPG